MKDLRFLVRRQFMSISSLYDDTENGGDDIRLFLSPQKNWMTVLKKLVRKSVNLKMELSFETDGIA